MKNLNNQVQLIGRIGNALELKETGKRYALITMCIGVGQGYAAIIENVTK